MAENHIFKLISLWDFNEVLAFCESDQCNLDITDSYGASPLIRMLMVKGYKELSSNESQIIDYIIIEMISSCKVNLGIQSYNRTTPLMYACLNGNIKIVEALLTSGIELYINSQDDDGDTALLCACMNDNIDIVLALLATGKSNPKLRTRYGNTVLDYARENECDQKIIYALENYDTN